MTDVLWSTVHAALDARRDPFDDPAVRAALEGAPDELEALLRLRGRLHGLASDPRPGTPAGSVRARRLRAPIAPLAFAALAAAAALALVLVLRRAPDERTGVARADARAGPGAHPSEGSEGPLRAPATPAPGGTHQVEATEPTEARLLSLRVVVELHGPDGLTERRVLTELAPTGRSPAPELQDRHLARREVRQRLLSAGSLVDTPEAFLGTTRITTTLQPHGLP